MKTEKIKELIENYYNVNLSEKSRRRDLVHLRFLYYHLGYYHSSDGYSLDRLGKTLDFDHATVLYALRQYKNLYEFDKQFKKIVDPFIDEVIGDIDTHDAETAKTLKKQVSMMKEKIIKIEKQLEEIL